MGEATRPLVTIGIPTFNRVASLERAVRSVLDQRYEALEVIIADNASTDGTRAFAEAIADPRVRYLPGATNVGATANYNRVRAAATGDYFMWLGDDDWLDDTYVATCVETLQARPELALAVGNVCYHHDGSSWSGVEVGPDGATGRRRVLQYYRRVKDNGTFYGLLPRWVLDQVGPLVNEMGNDMHLLAEVAYLGPVEIVRSTDVHRSVGGLTASLKRAAATAGMPWWQGEFPQLAIAWFGFTSVAWRSPVYRRESRLVRLGLGIAVAATVVGRFVPQAVPKYLRVLRARVGSRARRR